jgi:hypothetical protein
MEPDELSTCAEIRYTKDSYVSRRASQAKCVYTGIWIRHSQQGYKTGRKQNRFEDVDEEDRGAHEQA